MTVTHPPTAAAPARPADVPVADVSVSAGEVGLPAPPGPTGERSRTVFRYVNRWFAVPWHRAGLSAWLGTPLTGCQLLLTTTGRRSGRQRDTPLGYLVSEGAAWVLAGYGPRTDWYRNLLADPAVEVRLPGRPPFAARAHEASDLATRARIIPPLVRSMSLPGRLIGTDPATARDERILELVAWVPLIRLEPDGPPLVAGPDDPGGTAWVWRQGVALVVSLLVIAGLRRLVRR